MALEDIEDPGMSAYHQPAIYPLSEQVGLAVLANRLLVESLSSGGMGKKGETFMASMATVTEIKARPALKLWAVEWTMTGVEFILAECAELANAHFEHSTDAELVEKRSTRDITNIEYVSMPIEGDGS